MPITATIWEDPQSPTFSVGSNTTAERIYHALVSGTGTADEVKAAVYDAATGESPYYTNGLSRIDVKCKPEGGPLWEVRIGYGEPDGMTKTGIADGDQLASDPTTPPPPPPPPIPAELQPVTPPYIGGTGADDGGSNPLGGLGLGTPGSPEAPSADGQPSPNDPIGGEFSFEASEGVLHVDRGLETIHSLKPGGGAATDMGGLIGPKDDGSLEGVDIGTGEFEWSITRQARAISNAYLRSLSRAVGKTNEFSWYGYSPGELKFSGASGTFDRSKGWSITFKFKVKENEENIEVVGNSGPFGPQEPLIIPSKSGWDVLWTLTAQVANTPGNFPPLITIVKAAYVVRVLKKVSFQEYLGF